jgi:hypothetical protein
VALFDYGDANIDWVTDPGPNGKPATADRLAAAIKCLAARSGRPVSLVTYSLGGFIAKKALEGDAGSSVIGMVALATPWKGTTAAFANHVVEPTCAHSANIWSTLLIWVCAGGPLATPAARAMRTETVLSGITEPRIRSKIEVVPVAGTSDIDVATVFGGRRFLALGDVAMTPDSAWAVPAENVVDPFGRPIGKNEPGPTVSCHLATLNLGARPAHTPPARTVSSACWHATLQQHPDLAAIALPALARWWDIANAPLTTVGLPFDGGAGCGGGASAQQTQVSANPDGHTATRSTRSSRRPQQGARRAQPAPEPGPTQQQGGNASASPDREPQPAPAARSADPQDVPPAAPAAPKPFVGLDVTSGPPGTAIKATGGGFLPDKPITVTEAGPVGRREVGTMTAGADGSFTMYFKVSAPTLPGRDRITFTQGGSSVSATFTITDATPKAAVPAAPTDVHIDQFGTTGLRWNDNSDNEQGFHVYQSGRLVATEPANSTQLHGSLVGSCSDTLVVGAFNSAGEAKSTPVSYCTAHG